MNILTFDVEDWFHNHLGRKHYSGHIWDKFPSRVENNTSAILEFLDKLDRKATFFVLGWVAEKHPLLIKQIYNAGHEIGAHSYWHHNARFLTAEDFERDLQLCISRLTDIIGSPVRSYRAPGFTLRFSDTWAFDILSRNGILYDSSVKISGSSSLFPIPTLTDSGVILEFPLLLSKYSFPYSGGGYFRVLPKMLIKALFKNEGYRMLYFHPRDFDHQNPYTNLFSLYRNWLNSYNTGTRINFLYDLIRQRPSYTIEEAAQLFQK